MDIQSTKFKSHLDFKEKTRFPQKRSFGRPSSKEVLDDLDSQNFNKEIIPLDLDSEIKSYIEKLEKQVILNRTILSIQRNHFKEILSQVAIFLDKQEVSFDSVKKFFKRMDPFYFYSKKIKKAKPANDMEDLKYFLQQFEETSKPNFISFKTPNKLEEKDVLLIESDQEEEKGVKKPFPVPEDKKRKRKKINNNNHEGHNEQMTLAQFKSLPKNEMNDGFIDFDKEMREKTFYNPNFVNQAMIPPAESLAQTLPIWNFNGFIGSDHQAQNLFLMAHNLLKQSPEMLNGLNEFLHINNKN